jgi:hypothetical protein
MRAPYRKNSSTIAAVRTWSSTAANWPSAGHSRPSTRTPTIIMTSGSSQPFTTDHQ